MYNEIQLIESTRATEYVFIKVIGPTSVVSVVETATKNN